VGRKKKEGPPKKFVWVVVHIYHHRQAADVYVAETEADIPPLLGEVMKPSIPDIKSVEVRNAIKSCLAGLLYTKALELWTDWQDKHANYPEEIQVGKKEVYVYDGPAYSETGAGGEGAKAAAQPEGAEAVAG
jgi:hypothetical protein